MSLIHIVKQIEFGKLSQISGKFYVRIWIYIGIVAFAQCLLIIRKISRWLAQFDIVHLLFIFMKKGLPKKANKAVRFMTEPSPSGPFMKSSLNFLGLGRFIPPIM